jgi:hypothetical protein
VLIVWKFLFLMIRFAGFRNLTQSFFKCLREFLSGNYLFIYLFLLQNFQLDIENFLFYFFVYFPHERGT